MKANQNRLSILTQSEIQDYFGIPRLTQEDREYYFELADNEVYLIDDNWRLNSKLYFVLQLGYFKSKRIFFNFDADAVADDVSHIIGTYFPYDIGHEFKVPSKPTRINQQKLICQHFNFRRYDKHVRAELKDVARRVVHRSAKPIYILRELLSFLEKQQVVSPAYSTFQDLIGNCLSEEEYQWQHLESLSGSIKKNMRQIVRAIDFKSHAEETPLIEAITFPQLNFELGRILRRLPKTNFPIGFLTNALKKYVYAEKTPASLIAERYEFAVYKMLRKAFESGDVFNHKTNKYSSITDYLIPLNRWSKHKERILTELDLPTLMVPIQQTLNEFKITLEEKIQHVNQRILARENKDIKITGQGDKVKWTLPYKRDEVEENHHFYQAIPTIGIASLLRLCPPKNRLSRWLFSCPGSLCERH